MSSVYILELSNKNHYIGSTNNLVQRISDHENGNGGYTSKYLPLKLVFSQDFTSITEARKMENYLKRIKNRGIIDKIIREKFIKI